MTRTTLLRRRQLSALILAALVPFLCLALSHGAAAVQGDLLLAACSGLPTGLFAIDWDAFVDRFRSRERILQAATVGFLVGMWYLFRARDPR
jgi:hypothetical protein